MQVFTNSWKYFTYVSVFNPFFLMKIKQSLLCSFCSFIEEMCMGSEFWTHNWKFCAVRDAILEGRSKAV